MFTELVLRPAQHGVLGPLDEILTLLPLVIGVVLLVYLYFTARQAKHPADDAPPPNDDPADL